MSNEQTGFAQRSLEKIHFDHKDMDYYLSWMMGREIYDGSDRTELLETAKRIPNADVQAWHTEWSVVARRIEAQAEAALQKGDKESARKLFLRACTYHRGPLFIMGQKHPDFYKHWQNMQTCFRKAAELSNPVIEPIEVPFQGKSLSGYFWKADNSNNPRPTLVVVGGVETWAEDCYFIYWLIWRGTRLQCHHRRSRGSGDESRQRTALRRADGSHRQSLGGLRHHAS